MREWGPKPQLTGDGALPEELPPGRPRGFAGAPYQQMPLSATRPVELAPVSGPGVPLAHIHYPLEVGALLTGKQRRVFEEFSFDALPGDVWLIPVWEPHGWQTVDEKTDRVVMHFLPDLLGGEMIGDTHWLIAFAVQPHLRPRARGAQMRKQVMTIARELRAEIQGEEYGWVTAVRAGLLRLLTILYRSWERPWNAGSIAKLHPDSLARVMPAVEAIEQEPGRPMGVPEAAQLCSLSRRQFHRVFSHTLGVGFQEFALRARLGYAERLLTDTNLTVDTIARESGFVDHAHLHRHFVRRYGCAPGAFRKRVQAKG